MSLAGSAANAASRPKPAGQKTETTTGPSSQEITLSDALNVAADTSAAANKAKEKLEALQLAAKTRKLDLNDFFEVPPWLPIAFSSFQLGELCRVWDGPRAVGWTQYLGYAAAAGMLGMTAYSMSDRDTSTVTVPVIKNVFLDYSVYLLSSERSGDLTGAAKKHTQGLGMGSHLDATYAFNPTGLGISLKLDWQQSNLDANDYLHLTNFFYKYEPMVSFDVLKPIWYFMPEDWKLTRDWLSKSRLEARFGPSFFGDFIRIGDTQASRAGSDSSISQTIDLMSAGGFEYMVRADFDLVLLHLEAFIEGGSYPLLAYPLVTPDNFRVLQMITFDKLRGQDSYSWYRYKVVIDTPIPWLFGKTWSESARVKGGYEIYKLEGNKGEGLSNQAFTLSASWQF